MPIIDSFRMDGQVAVITGGGAGIGRGIAEILAEAGASVVVSDLTRDKAEAVAAGIRGAGGKAVATACNVTEEADLAALVEFALASFGKLTVLVNNAGGGGPKPFEMTMSYFSSGVERSRRRLYVNPPFAGRPSRPRRHLASA
jgi:7-alpha-hydroxysteroid dehydrogenase